MKGRPRAPAGLVDPTEDARNGTHTRLQQCRLGTGSAGMTETHKAFTSHTSGLQDGHPPLHSATNPSSGSHISATIHFPDLLVTISTAQSQLAKDQEDFYPREPGGPS